jgi:hypothetical protein
MEVVMKERDDFMRLAGTYCDHPNSDAATVNLKPKMSVLLAILVSCRK